MNLVLGLEEKNRSYINSTGILIVIYHTSITLLRCRSGDLCPIKNMMEAAYDISYHRRRRYSSKRISGFGNSLWYPQNRSKADLALIYSDLPCAAAAVYTQNLVKGAPIAVTKRNIADGMARAVICNSGNANTCNADGRKKHRKCVI